MQIYRGIRGADPKIARGQWWFRDKDGNIVSKVTFAHIERDEDVHKWQGAQICEIGFDELTHFSEKTFFYMLSRNRSTCGVTPFVRATCNPDADSWVAKFIEWWIDKDTGYPIQERSARSGGSSAGMKRCTGRTPGRSSGNSLTSRRRKNGRSLARSPSSPRSCKTTRSCCGSTQATWPT